ncbi:hypothetical protein J6590_003861 [Homalodisca vitripennis]|nr:hypothetical protein J6590_003861 [Homalodisca vitripennis]
MNSLTAVGCTRSLNRLSTREGSGEYGHGHLDCPEVDFALMPRSRTYSSRQVREVYFDKNTKMYTYAHWTGHMTMTVGVGGVCSLTSEFPASLNKSVPLSACFDWRGWFRGFLCPNSSSWISIGGGPTPPYLTHPEYPVTPEIANKNTKHITDITFLTESSVPSVHNSPHPQYRKITLTEFRVPEKVVYNFARVEFRNRIICEERLAQHLGWRPLYRGACSYRHSSSRHEARAKKPSLSLNLGTNGLKVTSEPPPMVGQAGCLQGQDRSAITHPSISHALCCLIRLYTYHWVQEKPMCHLHLANPINIQEWHTTKHKCRERFHKMERWI